MQQKEQYAAVDIFKLICALLVVGIHWEPFIEYGEKANFLFSSVFCRIAVPFFFVSAGYFLKDKLQSWKETGKYLLRLLQLYMVYTVPYLPMIFQEIYHERGDMAGRIRLLVVRLFWRGSYLQFWFFPALIIGVCIVFVLRNKLHLPRVVLAILAVGLWIIGVISAPNYVQGNSNEVNQFLVNLNLAYNARDAIFWGFPFVYFGNMIYEKRSYLRLGGEVLGLAIGIVIWTMEVYVASEKWNCVYASNWFGAAISATSLFLILLRIPANINLGKWCRSLSTWIFGIHMYVYNEFSFVIGDVNHLVRCMFFMGTIWVMGMILICLSKTKQFAWLSNIF